MQVDLGYSPVKQFSQYKKFTVLQIDCIYYVDTVALSLCNGKLLLLCEIVAGFWNEY